MRKKNTKIENIRGLIKDLPYFTVINLSVIEKNRGYLKISLSRMSKSGEIIRLKKGMYVSKNYLDSVRMVGKYNDYCEFISSAMYEPAYLSAEYVMAEHNLLTEAVYNFTLVSTNKTNSIINGLGSFSYYTVKKDLFFGFKLKPNDYYLIYKASLAKALFDFLYIRKDLFINSETVDELRLNLENLKNKDIAELKKYIKKEGSKKMKNIFNWLKLKNKL